MSSGMLRRDISRRFIIIIIIIIRAVMSGAYTINYGDQKLWSIIPHSPLVVWSLGELPLRPHKP